ncbi:MAG TPA: ROK family protein [Nevskiaceae bacterium]|nr:ROK family protein [Nevskiaceae bacterium]
MYLGVDVGGTKTLVACLDDQGIIQQQLKFPTPKIYAEFLSNLAKSIVNLPTKEFVAAGIAVPGKIDREHGTGIAFGNLPWERVPIQTDVQRMLGCPVVLENDAKVAGLSEAMLLKERYRKVLYITIGTGIGTALIIDKRIDPDFDDMEGGHMPLEHNGKIQSWEDFASGRAIFRRFGKKASEITDEKTWKLIAHDIAIGLIDLVAVVQPEVIVFGGGAVSNHFQRFGDLLRHELKKYETPLVPIPPLRRAERPEQAVVYGCYDLAKELHGKFRS